MPARTCAGCGVALPPPKGSGRPRVRCETCAPPIRKAKPAAVVALPATQTPTGIVASTRSELEKADRLDTVYGQAALVLADQLANGQHSGAGYAALVKELRATMAQALEGASVEADPLDEIKRARDRKLGRA